MPEKSEDSASGEAEMADSRGLVTRLLLTIAIFPCILRLFWQRSLAQAAARFGRRAARASPKRLELRSRTVPCGKSARVLLATVPGYLAFFECLKFRWEGARTKNKAGPPPCFRLFEFLHRSSPLFLFVEWLRFDRAAGFFLPQTWTTSPDEQQCHVVVTLPAALIASG